MKDNPYYDEYERAQLIDYSCPCCDKCRLYVSGRKAGSCFYGGPYFGYILVSDEDKNLLSK